MDDQANAVAYHDALADGWEKRYGRGGFARRARFIGESILPVLPPIGAWLDAGCGTGTFSRLLAGAGRSVVGVDASVRMVAEAKRRANISSDWLSFSHIDTIEHLPFESSVFDGVICFSVLEYIERPIDALAELARILRPGGMLICSVPHKGSALRAGQRLYRFLRGAGPKDFGYLQLSRFATTPDSMREALAPHGLTLSKALGFDPLLPPAVHPVLKPSLVYLIFHKSP